ncbi:MAG: hypothetical protein IJV45_01870 [Prevotella sp.]|nr:hypothetical protein [Prevotella sp.]
MKKNLLLIAGLMATTAIGAQTSPWAGNDLPAEGGTYYLYQVQTGKWLQNNNVVPEDWTTRAQLGPYGLDIEIVAQDGGYRLNPKFGHNHSINGWDDFLYLDTGRDATIWTLEKQANGYYWIYTGNQEHFINTNDEGFLDDFGMNYDWQLVTREERMADLTTATKANPKDATWLIGGHDFANQDERNQWDVIQEGDGVYAQGGDGIVHGNRAVECWKKTNFRLSKTITGLPNGTYRFQLQGFYRDGSEVNIGNKRAAGEEVIRASYYINDVTRPFMSILDGGAAEEDLDSYAVPQGGVYIPGNSVPGNALDRASNCFFKGGYWNEPVEVVVSDGTLTIGMQKIGGGDDDWLVFDSFTLTYLGSEIDLGPVLANLNAAIADAEAYDGAAVAVLTSALAEAKALTNSTDAVAIANATMALRNALAAAQNYSNILADAEAFDGVKTDFFTAALEAAKQAAAEQTDLDEFNKAVEALNNALNDVRGAQDPLRFIELTIPFAREAGVDADIIARAQAVTEHAESLGDINNALNQLRIARKIKKADKQADVYQGNTPEDGDFYIYNVGLQRFLCGGGDWGAHAYVGFPGVEVTLISSTEFPEDAESFSGYKIDTHLNNGGESEYLNYGGYMDTPTQNLWEFVPVEGKTGVYVIARANGEQGPDGRRMLLGYRPGTYGNIDTDMYGEEDPNNQWKLVKRADRDALLATATADKPQDATYLIQSPNFNQREDVSAWVSAYSNGAIFGRLDNHPDFAYECWNQPSFDLSQTVYDLLPGFYAVGVQGFYRDGDHENQIRVIAAGGDARQDAVLTSFDMVDSETILPNITTEVDKAPGLGDRRTVLPLIPDLDENGQEQYDDNGNLRMKEDQSVDRQYLGEFPYNIDQACEYFQNGLYKSHLLVEVGAGGELMFIIQKERGDVERDWVVVDNFRLTYYGTTKPTEEQLGVKDVQMLLPVTGRTYNLQGQQVSLPQKGLFIRDGRKFYVK